MSPQRHPQDPGYGSERLPQTPVSAAGQRHWVPVPRKRAVGRESLDAASGATACAGYGHCFFPRRRAGSGAALGLQPSCQHRSCQRAACASKEPKLGPACWPCREEGPGRSPCWFSSRVEIKWLDFVLMEKKKNKNTEKLSLTQTVFFLNPNHLQKHNSKQKKEKAFLSEQYALFLFQTFSK